jgi:hypothetical protein
VYEYNRISSEARERRRRREYEAIAERAARASRASIWRRRLPRLSEALRHLPLLHRERLAG